MWCFRKWWHLQSGVDVCGAAVQTILFKRESKWTTNQSFRKWKRTYLWHGPALKQEALMGKMASHNQGKCVSQSHSILPTNNEISSVTGADSHIYFPSFCRLHLSAASIWTIDFLFLICPLWDPWEQCFKSNSRTKQEKNTHTRYSTLLLGDLWVSLSGHGLCNRCWVNSRNNQLSLRGKMPIKNH